MTTQRAVSEEMKNQPTVTAARAKAAQLKLEPPLVKTSFWAPSLKGPDLKRWFDHATITNLRSVGVEVFRPTIRSSAISCYRTCPRKFLYRYRLGLDTIDYVASLDMGKIYHLVLRKLYEGYSMSSALHAAAQKIAKREAQVEDAANQAGILPSGKTVSQTLSEMSLDLQKAKVMAVWVWDSHPLDHSKWEVWGTETLIEMKYRTLVSKVRCRLDALLRKKGTNELYITDHKTTSFSTVTFAATVPFQIQPMLYRVCTHSLVRRHLEKTGEDLVVRGFIHDVTQKPTIRLKQKETWEEYVERIAVWYREKTQKSPHDPPFLRSTVRFNDDEGMSRQLLLILREADRACGADCDADSYYQDPTGRSCFLYNKACPYLPLCTRDFRDWPDLINNLYVVRNRDIEDEEEAYE